MDEIKMQGILEKGYGIIPKLVMLDKSLSIESKAIYGYLASFCGNGQSAFPGADKIQADLKISEKRFYKYRKELIDKGYIEITAQRQKNRRGNNLYTLKMAVPEHSRFERVQNECIQNERVQNGGTNNNNINNNSINNNNLNNNNIEAVRKLLKVSVKEAEKILAVANNNLDVVVEKWKVIQEYNLKNKVGALITAIKDNWNASPHKGANKSNFNNYEQRTYDFEVLEKKLLGWSEEDEG